MKDVFRLDLEKVADRLCQQARDDRIRITLHGHQKMIEEDISYEVLREVLLRCRVIENYPEHQRGPCCLVYGYISDERFLHIVCTTTLENIVVITVYEPKEPKWVTPFRRGGEHEM